MKNIIKKLIVAISLIMLFVLAAVAEEVAQGQLDQQMEKNFLEQFGNVKETIPLRPVDKEILALAGKLANPDPGMAPQPTKAPNGAVSIMYGTYTPRVLCRPLRVTDVQLEPGERITSPPFIGDSINWQLYPAVSGSGENTIYHIMIKPIMPDIATNLIIHTNRRTYTMDLVSHKTNWTPYIVFNYPDDGSKQWVDFIKTHDASDYDNRSGNSSPDNLNFDYTAKANRKNIEWQPLRVWDDGLKTYIEFPARINAIEAPVVMLLNGKSQEVVNYRKTGNYYILDKLIKKAVLTLGSGKTVERVVITRNGA